MKLAFFKQKIMSFFKKRPFLSFLFSLLPFLVSLGVSPLGSAIGVYSKENKMKSGWVYTFITLSALFILFSAITQLRTKLDIDNEIKKQRLHLELMSNLSLLNKTVIEDYSNIIAKDKYKGVYRAIEPFSKTGSRVSPIHHINVILCSVLPMLKYLFGLNENGIGVSILYFNVKMKKWEYLFDKGISGELKSDDICSNTNSTFYSVKDTPGDKKLYPDKNIAVKEGHYIPNAIEVKEGKSSGSIYCKNISIIKGGRVYFQAVLSITTYQQQFCYPTDYASIERLYEFFDCIESSIRGELAAYCLHRHMGLCL